MGVHFYNGFSWTGPNGYINSSQNIYSLFAGNYTVTATDNNGCTSTESFLVNESSEILISAANIEYKNVRETILALYHPLSQVATHPMTIFLGLGHQVSQKIH